ncbi:MAG: epoxyqueuosine reductase QueH [Candidatus Omnitrophota bacterium]
MKKILLHICCAPCAIFPINLLKERGFKVQGFFFNPNIHPLREYNRRLEAVLSFAKTSSLEIDCSPYEPKLFFQVTNQKEEAPVRCYACWQLRLKQVALKAKENKFEYFTSTLLGSPYQDTTKLEEIGRQLAEETEVEFFIADFKSGFRQAHNEARDLGIYCQKYCGCIYSEIERSKTKNEKICCK